MDTTPRTWEEAFNSQPVPKIKNLERELRANILSDKEKLRSLVGSNYRDLLTTAERITSLSADAILAEQSISSLSQACHQPEIQAGVRSPARSTRIAAEFRLANSLVRLCSLALRQRVVDRASKIWVLARLIVNHLDESSGGSPSIAWLQKRVKQTRRALQDCINTLLILPTTSLQRLVEAATAHCLVTSTSSAEAVSHLLQLRARKLASLEQSEGTSKIKISQVTQACHYLVSSVAAARVIAGRRVSDVLSEIQRRPLMEDASVAGTESLQLDLVKHLISADILHFTPYFKRTLLKSTELATTIRNWTEQSCQELVKRLGTALTRCNLAGILYARSEVFKALLPALFSAQLHHSALDTIRSLFVERIRHQLESHAHSLEAITTSLTIADVSASSANFWELQLVPKDPVSTISMKELHSSRFGIDKSIKAPLDGLRAFLDKTKRYQEELAQLGRSRWHDIIEDSDEDEHEHLARKLVQTLNKTEPESCKTILDQAITKACNKCVSQLETAVGTSQDTGSDTGRSVVLLRIIREMSAAIRMLLSTHEMQALANATKQLEHQLATETMAALKPRIDGIKVDESSANEDLPSPSTILLLKHLCKSMLVTGGVDLWTSSAVSQLTTLVCQQILDAPGKEKFVVTPFDEHYLGLALGIKSGVTNEEEALTFRKAELYWNRTRSLWGLLDTRSSA